MKTAVVLLSGGMDSTVAAFMVADKNFMGSDKYDKLILVTFDYGQKAIKQEVSSAAMIGRELALYAPTLEISQFIHDINGMFGFSGNSLTSVGTAVDQYENVEEAIAETAGDRSYIPLRNAVFFSIAASILMTHSPEGGHIITGIRARPDGSGGFPDCTRLFAGVMSRALTEGAGKQIEVVDALNRWAPSRTETVKLAQELGCLDALKYTFSCFEGKPDFRPCGHCLPCLRRAQAFATVGIPDPALERFKHD